MKKVLMILLLILLVNVSDTNAGKIIPLDFNERESYVIPIYLTDAIMFEFDGDSHTIILDEIKDRRVEFDVFIYQERNKKIEIGEDRDVPIYAFADTVNLLKFDLNRDGVFDLKLDVLDYDPQKALIELTKIDETKENTIISPINTNNSNVEKKFYNNTLFLMSVVALIIIILLIIILNKIKKDKKWSYH